MNLPNLITIGRIILAVLLAPLLFVDRFDIRLVAFIVFLIAAFSRLFAQYPQLNATYDDDAQVITRHGSVHMGMATQTPNGLMVAVIRDAQNRDLWTLAAEIARLAEAARAARAALTQPAGQVRCPCSAPPSPAPAVPRPARR